MFGHKSNYFADLSIRWGRGVTSVGKVVRDQSCGLMRPERPTAPILLRTFSQGCKGMGILSPHSIENGFWREHSDDMGKCYFVDMQSLVSKRLLTLQERTQEQGSMDASADSVDFFQAIEEWRMKIFEENWVDNCILELLLSALCGALCSPSEKLLKLCAMLSTWKITSAFSLFLTSVTPPWT